MRQLASAFEPTCSAQLIQVERLASPALLESIRMGVFELEVVDAYTSAVLVVGSCSLRVHLAVRMALQ